MDNSILTLEDFCQLCFESNLEHLPEGKSVKVSMPGKSSMENFSEDESPAGLRPFACFAYHDHVNLNRSAIDEKLFKEKLKDLNLRPILAQVLRDPDTGKLDFGGHARGIVDQGTEHERIAYLEQPVGVICGNQMMVADPETGVNRAKVYGFLYETYCPEVIQIIEESENQTVDVSIELMVNAFTYDSKTKLMTIEDYDVSGVTLLGSAMLPGMKGSKLSLHDFEQKEMDTNQLLVDTLERLNETLERFDMQKGGQGMDEIKDEVIDETVDEEPDVLPEIEAEANEDKAPEEEATPVEMSLKDKIDLIYSAMSKWTDSVDPTLIEIGEYSFVWKDWETCGTYRMRYEIENAQIVFPDEPEEVVLFSVSPDEVVAYSALKEKNESIMKELERYQLVEKNRQMDEILNDASYKQFLETPRFKEVAENRECTVEEFKQKCDLCFAELVKQSMNFSLDESESTRMNLAPADDHKVRGRYGNLGANKNQRKNKF